MSGQVDRDRLFRETFVVRVEHHATLGSTNARARECTQGPSGALPLLVLADEQTEGRGRRSHRWWTGQGGLAFSVLLDAAAEGVEQSRWPMAGLAAALAVVDAIAPLLSAHDVGLHWPNDVLVGQRKIAGVLVEMLPRRHCVIGIGVNTNSSMAEAPADLRERATTLLDLTGKPHDQTAILVEILQRLAAGLRRLRETPDEIGRRAHALCTQLGQTLTICNVGQPATTGRCVEIAADGALVLDTSEGRREFHSGWLARQGGGGEDACRLSRG